MGERREEGGVKMGERERGGGRERKWERERETYIKAKEK